MIRFTVKGNPVPKQSFKKTRFGGYTPPRTKEWQDAVSWAAREAMEGQAPIDGAVMVTMIFTLPDKRVRDLDNLSKCVLDGMRKIVYNDDRQVINLNLWKAVAYKKAEPGVYVEIKENYREDL